MRLNVSIALLVLLATVARSQECERNMLSIHDSTGYGKVSRGMVQLAAGFTIEGWVKAASTVQDAGILEFGQSGDSGIFSIRVGAFNSLVASFGFTGGRELIEAPLSQSLFDWNHVAVTFTPNDSLRLFINGVQVASKRTTAMKLRAPNGDSLYFGYSALSGSAFIGDLDEVRIWSAPRSQAQIAASLTATFIGTGPNLAGYWRFDDDTLYSRFHDFSNRNLNGIIVGSAELKESTSPLGEPNHPGYMIVGIETAVDMGTIYCSEKKDTVVRIRNVGLETLVVGVIGFDLGGRGIFSIIPKGTEGIPMPPDPGAIATVGIQANPNFPGVHTDTLVITTTNVCGGKLRIPVRVTVVPTGLTLDSTRATVVFPKAKPFLPCELPFTKEVDLTNTGNRNITIRSLRFIENAGVTVENINLPFTLLPKQTRKIKVTFEQGQDGTFFDTLVATAFECNRMDSLAFEFSRASIAYDLSARTVVFPEVRLLPKSTVVRDTDILVVNTGSADIYIQEFSIIGTKYFKFRGVPTSKYLRPGDSTLIKIRFQSAECGDFQGAVSFSAPTGCPFRDTVFFSIRVRGPEFAPVRTAYNLEATCTVPKDTIVGIINRSGVPVSILNVRFLKNEFKFAVPPLPAQAVAAGDTFYVKVRFAPTLPGRQRDTVRFFTEPCGFVDISLEGYWGVGEIVLSDSIVDFGQGCDLQQQQRSISITNTTGKPFTISARTSSGSPAITFPLPQPLVVLAGQTKSLDFVFTPAAFGNYETNFVLTDGSCFVAEISAHGVRERASVRWQNATLDLGEHCPDTTVIMPITLHNDGFGSVHVLDGWSNDPHFNWSNVIGMNVEPKDWRDLPVTFHADSIGAFNATLTLILGPCGDTVTLPVTGIGGPAPQLRASTSVINFGDVPVGDSAFACFELTNPSCIPITVTADDILIALTPPEFTIGHISNTLPFALDATHPLKVCFWFKPTTDGVITSQAMVNVDGAIAQLALIGRGVRPIVRYEPISKIIDFGDVVIGDDTTARFIILNYGTDTAHLTWESVPDLPFSTVTVPLPAKVFGKPDTVYVNFKPDKYGPVTSKYVLSWDGNRDEIIVRGRGIAPGLRFDISDLSFGDIRVDHDSVMTIRIRGTENAPYPIKTSMAIIEGNQNFTVVAPVPNVLLLNTSTDEIVYHVRYRPRKEEYDSAYFVIKQGTQEDRRLLTGRGVEAHIYIEEAEIDFGPVVLGDSILRTVNIHDTGTYRLTVDSAVSSLSTVFTDSTESPIAPGNSKPASIYFAPKQATDYFDSLLIYSDDPARKIVKLYLRGRGVYTQGEPHIVYRVADAAVRVGDVIELPVYVSGDDVGKVVVDSLYLEIRYDPTVGYVHEVITENTVAVGMQYMLDRHYADSTLRIQFTGSPRRLRDGILCKLRVEALLGPSDSTRFMIQKAVPRDLGNALLNAGSFFVTDCNNYRTKILLKGPYSISTPQPNPASGIVALQYELGLDGPVRIAIADALGREVKTVVDRYEQKGRHQVTFSIADLPSGSYLFTITSLEYRETGKLLIAQ